MSRCACGFAGTVSHSWQPNRPIMAPIMAPHRRGRAHSTVADTRCRAAISMRRRARHFAANVSGGGAHGASILAWASAKPPTAWARGWPRCARSSRRRSPGSPSPRCLSPASRCTCRTHHGLLIEPGALSPRRLRFSYDSTVLRSNDLRPHPYIRHAPVAGARRNTGGLTAHPASGRRPRAGLR
jgi:hypothetical protein